VVAVVLERVVEPAVERATDLELAVEAEPAAVVDPVVAAEPKVEELVADIVESPEGGSQLPP
jgi:hypothetical protein